MRTDDFKSLFRKGIFKTNRYLVTIDGLHSDLEIKLPREMLKRAVYNVTAENVETEVATSKTYGEPVISVGFVRTSGTLEVSFINDAEGQVKEFLDAWIDAQRNKKTHEIKYAEKYMAKVMKIVAMSQTDDKILYTNEYNNVFPTKIGGVIYSYDSGSIIPLINVTLQYSSTDSYKGDVNKSKNARSNTKSVDDSYQNQISFKLNNDGIGNTLEDDLFMTSRYGVNDVIVDRINIDNDILSGKKDIV